MITAPITISTKGFSEARQRYTIDILIHSTIFTSYWESKRLRDEFYSKFLVNQEEQSITSAKAGK
jgi:hypothetical protein